MSRTHALLAVALLAAAPLVAGCASNCGANCPPIEVAVYASPGETLNWTTDTKWEGPGCPPYPPSCRGDDVNNCIRFGMIAGGPGVCDFTIVFKDRPPFMVHAEFGEDPHVGCCKGFPVIGQTTYVVPPLPGYDAGSGPSSDAGAADMSVDDGATD